MEYRYVGGGTSVAYEKERNGSKSSSEMPVGVALEILRRSSSNVLDVDSGTISTEFGIRFDSREFEAVDMEEN